VYEALLAQDGIHLPHGSGPADPSEDEAQPVIAVPADNATA
jgi:hypothetical protein